MGQVQVIAAVAGGLVRESDEGNGARKIEDKDDEHESGNAQADGSAEGASKPGSSSKLRKNARR